jgi:uncharacterized protein with HEPN domain
MFKELVEYLKHIRAESSYLMSIIEKGIDKDEFLKEETLKRAVVRSLEVIGEATKKIPADFKVKWEKVRWKDMAGMRDRLKKIKIYHNSNIYLNCLQLFSCFMHFLKIGSESLN